MITSSGKLIELRKGKNMDKNVKTLKLLSKLFAVMAVIDALIVLLLLYVKNDATLMNGMTNAMGSLDANSALIASLITVVLSFVIDLFLALKGLKQAKGEPVGTAHITLATIFFVLSVIGLLAAIFGLFKGGDVATVLYEVINVVLYHFYRVSAKRVNH
jgi:hypothetical protein